jgi:CDP-diacylglycerol--glycerol-3-phosphate 3-phosphatidyltransferase
VLNAANLVTLGRIAVTPVFLWFLLTSYKAGDPVNWILLLAFILIAASDGIDGAIARKQNTVTKLGKLLDPIADKILLGGSFIVLSVLGVLDWWITVLILVREVAMTVYRLIVVKNKVIPASASGKSKTIVQAIAIGYLISPLHHLLANQYLDIGSALAFASLVLTWWSAFQYFKDSRS